MLCMFAMVFKCFSGVFSSVSEACFKCFICLQTYVATVAFECFKSRSGVTSLLLAFCYIVSVCPPPGVGRASIRRRGGRVLPNRRLPPSPLVARAAWAPRGAKQSAACERPSGRPGASTAVRDRVNLE
jgi:hypothetical protein